MIVIGIIWDTMILLPHSFPCLNKMINPISYVKNTRTSYSKFLEKSVKEVQVQFDDENPAWIPYDTLIAIDRMIANEKK